MEDEIEAAKDAGDPQAIGMWDRVLAVRVRRARQLRHRTSMSTRFRTWRATR